MNNRFKLAVRCWSQCLTTISTDEREREKEKNHVNYWIVRSRFDSGWRCRLERLALREERWWPEARIRCRNAISRSIYSWSWTENNQSDATWFRLSNRPEVPLCSISATDFFRQVFAVEHWLASKACWELIAELEYERSRRSRETGKDSWATDLRNLSQMLKMPWAVATSNVACLVHWALENISKGEEQFSANTIFSQSKWSRFFTRWQCSDTDEVRNTSPSLRLFRVSTIWHFLPLI